MKKIFIYCLISIFLSIFNVTATRAVAPCICSDGTNKGELSIEECIKSCGANPSATVSLDNPLGKGATDIPTLLGKIIQSVLGVVGSLALVMFIYGGATWMLSGGNQERVTKGKQTITWAALGIIIIFTAYALVRFVLTTIGAAA